MHVRRVRYLAWLRALILRQIKILGKIISDKEKIETVSVPRPPSPRPPLTVSTLPDGI
jgi:hypothetical protein